MCNKNGKQNHETRTKNTIIIQTTNVTHMDFTKFKRTNTKLLLVKLSEKKT